MAEAGREESNFIENFTAFHRCHFMGRTFYRGAETNGGRVVKISEATDSMQLTRKLDDACRLASRRGDRLSSIARDESFFPMRVPPPSIPLGRKIQRSSDPNSSRGPRSNLNSNFARDRGKGFERVVCPINFVSSSK